MPAMYAACNSQRATQKANAKASRAGARKLTNPIDSAGLRCRRSVSGSSSAPARKVSRPEPKIARKSIHGVVWMWKTSPAKTPTRISTSATEMPSRIDTRLAVNASAIQAAATSQMLDSTLPPFQGTKKPAGPVRPGRSHHPPRGWRFRANSIAHASPYRDDVHREEYRHREGRVNRLSVQPVATHTMPQDQSVLSRTRFP